jgi:hypothetical protein
MTVATSSAKPESQDLTSLAYLAPNAHLHGMVKVFTISAHSNGTISCQVGEFRQLGKLSQCAPFLPVFLNAERWPT